MPPISHAEVAAALKRAGKIPGLYNEAESTFLYHLARRRGTLVEIGCWMGRTTALLVQAAGVWGANVVSIDPFAPMPHGYAQGSAEQWRANLGAAGLQAPELREMTSAAAAQAWAGEIALLFIDGDHSYPEVLYDLMAWSAFVKVGGVVAVHDMFHPHAPDVCEAVSFWWVAAGKSGQDQPWRLIGLHDYTIAFERLN